jgi:hypothetical protein
MASLPISFRNSEKNYPNASLNILTHSNDILIAMPYLMNLKTFYCSCFYIALFVISWFGFFSNKHFTAGTDISQKICLNLQDTIS